MHRNVNINIAKIKQLSRGFFTLKGLTIGSVIASTLAASAWGLMNYIWPTQTEVSLSHNVLILKLPDRSPLRNSRNGSDNISLKDLETILANHSMHVEPEDKEIGTVRVEFEQGAVDWFHRWKDQPLSRQAPIREYGFFPKASRSFTTRQGIHVPRPKATKDQIWIESEIPFPVVIPVLDDLGHTYHGLAVYPEGEHWVVALVYHDGHATNLMICLTRLPPTESLSDKTIYNVGLAHHETITIGRYVFTLVSMEKYSIEEIKKRIKRSYMEEASP